MADTYAVITEADVAVQERLAGVLELRAADPQQRLMLESYTAELQLPRGARVLEVGCGTGAVSRFLTTLPNVGAIVGLDPCAMFIERARELAADTKLEFAVGDGRELDFDDGSFDAAVFHTTLCHLPDCEQALAEANRVVQAGGQLAVFDGDYATTTVAIGTGDPLQACIDAAMRTLVHDPWVMRGVERLLCDAGFADIRVRGHAYTQTTDADYMLTLVERGADALAAEGTISAATADGLKAEAGARVGAGTFFGHIAYVSAIARRV
jgi:ubiquinone/menaquinone biosynthesis C-methylase UbiE